jgi:hypothetical protein
MWMFRQGHEPAVIWLQCLVWIIEGIMLLTLVSLGIGMLVLGVGIISRIFI